MSQRPDSLDEQLDYLEEEEPGWKEELGVYAQVSKGDQFSSLNALTSILTEKGKEQYVHSSDDTDVSAEDVDGVIHMGCYGPRTPLITKSMADILSELEYESVVVGGHTNCCGILDILHRDTDTAERVENNRFENMGAFDPDFAVTECTTCHAITKKISYGFRDPGFEFPFMAEFMLNHKDQIVDNVEVTDPVTVTIHDHFDLMGWIPEDQQQAIRELFSALPGIEIAEMEHNQSDRLPCGKAGVDEDEYLYDDLTHQIYREAQSAGADVLINVNHGCHWELLKYEHEFPIATKNYCTFVAERLGYEYQSKNREYFQALAEDDIDQVVEDARPAFESHGIAEDEAREIIREHWGK